MFSESLETCYYIITHYWTQDYSLQVSGLKNKILQPSLILGSNNTSCLTSYLISESVFPSVKMGKINVFLKRLFWETNWIHKEELTKLQFLSLFIHITFSIAVSLRKCLETLPGLTQKPFNITYEDGLFSLFYGGSNSTPQPQTQLLHP